jgi:uncharacterized protein (DUF305 family)
VNRTPVKAAILVVAVLAGFAVGWAVRAPDPVADPQPGVVDIGFCQDMAVHHAQALLMAQQALTFSTSPMVRAVATQILVGQSQERGTLTGWLTLWQAPQLPSGPPMTWMRRMGPHDDHGAAMPGMAGGMPGMATQAELDQLGNARGPEFDTLFVTLMTRHHLGGIQMAAEARDQATLPEVRALAGTMVIAQTEENAVMGQLVPGR